MRFARKHTVLDNILEIPLCGRAELTLDIAIVSVFDVLADPVFLDIHHIGGFFIKIWALNHLAVIADDRR